MGARHVRLMRGAGTVVLALGLLATGWAVANATVGTSTHAEATTTGRAVGTSLETVFPTPVTVRGSSIGVPDLPCCQATSTGLTTTGQATLKGSGTRVRDAAIRDAVADATDQARVAAGAAGITLGPIVSVEVNTSGSLYPIPLESGGSAPASGGTACACPPGPPCPCPTASPTTYASVVITWAIS